MLLTCYNKEMKTIYKITFSEKTFLMALDDRELDNFKKLYVEVKEHGKLSLNHRYLLFAYSQYYPYGGINDLLLSSDKLSDIEDFFALIPFLKKTYVIGYDRFRVFDREDDSLIKKLTL